MPTTTPRPATDPARLAHTMGTAAVALAKVLATDVSIQPTHIAIPVQATSQQLVRIADELSKAIMPADPQAALALGRAGAHFAAAARELRVATESLSREPG